MNGAQCGAGTECWKMLSSIDWFHLFAGGYRRLFGEQNSLMGCVYGDKDLNLFLFNNPFDFSSFGLYVTGLSII